MKRPLNLNTIIMHHDIEHMKMHELIRNLITIIMHDDIKYVRIHEFPKQGVSLKKIG